MVDELDRKHFNLVKVFENRNVDMQALGNVEEHSIDEKQESLNVQKLAPRKTEVKEELSKPLVVDT
jgi:hypothetical protein